MNDAKKLKLWRRRGFYSETVLVKKLEELGFFAVRIPVSNPSTAALPDVLARRNLHVYAFEVKNARYYAYFPRSQIEKLFRCLDGLFPLPMQYKHAFLAAHLGKKWILKEIDWQTYLKGKIPEKFRICHRDHTHLQLKKKVYKHKGKSKNK